MNKYKCPCCGYFTLSEKPPGTYEICPVCLWEDDPVQFKDSDYEGGANHVSLNQCKANFSQFGASRKDRLPHVRKPLDSEKE